MQRSPTLRSCLGLAAAAALSYRRCSIAEEDGLLLLEYHSWQRLLEMQCGPQGTTANFYDWLPHWSRRAPTMPSPHAPTS